MLTTPLLLAFNDKGALLSVVVIELPLIKIPSNVASAPTVKLFVTFVFPVTVILPPCVIFPVMFTLPLTWTSCIVVVPPTVKFWSVCKSLDGITTFPVPLAYNSKSALELVTCIVFVLILKSSTFNSFTHNCFHFNALVPREYTLSVVGIILLAM